MKTRKSILMTILAMTFILSSHLVKAQFPIDSLSGQVKFTGVVDLPDMPKDIIYQKVKLWIVSTLKSGDNMVELNGTNSNQIVGTGTLILDSLYIDKNKNAAFSSLNFKFIVFCKDNKLKYSVENFNLHFEIKWQSGYNIETSQYNTKLEKMENPYFSLSEKKLVIFKEKNTIYIKDVIDKLILDFISNMTRKEDNNW